MYYCNKYKEIMNLNMSGSKILFAYVIWYKKITKKRNSTELSLSFL